MGSNINVSLPPHKGVVIEQSDPLGILVTQKNNILSELSIAAKCEKSVEYIYIEKGLKGADGRPGAKGEDGRSAYIHIKYSDVANPTNANQFKEGSGLYIGIYVDNEQYDSLEPSDYTWTRLGGASISIGVVNTVAPDKSAAVRNTGTPLYPILEFDIPRGKGIKYEDLTPAQKTEMINLITAQLEVGSNERITELEKQTRLLQQSVTALDNKVKQNMNNAYDRIAVKNYLEGAI